MEGNGFCSEAGESAQASPPQPGLPGTRFGSVRGRMSLIIFVPRLAVPGLAAAAAVAALAGSSAGAAPAPPRAIGYLANEMSPPVARCLLRREPALVDRWLKTLPGSPQETRLVRSADPRFPACFDRWGHMQGGWMPKYDTAGMRATLVRALLQARRPTLPADLPAGSGLPWYSPDAGADPAAIVAADLGSCLARKHWSNVLAIVRAVDPETEHSWHTGSGKAKAARKREAATVDSELGRMIPSVAGCVPVGAKLRIERPRLRTLVEEAALHMIDGTRPVEGRDRAFNDR